jgi:hypothetical protein
MIHSRELNITAVIGMCRAMTGLLVLGGFLFSANAFALSAAGYVDQVGVSPGYTTTVSGWACIQDSNDSVSLQIYAGDPRAGGVPIAAGLANKASEQAVANACHASGTAYRYEIQVDNANSIKYSGQALFVVEGSSASIVSQPGLKIPYFASGYVDDASSVGSSFDLRGWACVKGSNASVNLEVFAGDPNNGGSLIATGTADQGSEPAVASACQASGSHYRYLIEIAPTQVARSAGLPLFVREAYTHGSVSQPGLWLPTFVALALGYVDRISALPPLLSVDGWACLQGMSSSVNVQVFAGDPSVSGVLIGQGVANSNSEGAVANRCSVSSGQFRFNIPITSSLVLKYAGQPVYVREVSTRTNLPQSGAISLPTVWAPQSNFLGSDATLPGDIGVVNVRDPMFGAFGDGVHDDTAAILRAINYRSLAPILTMVFKTNYVYLPPGTYKVSDTIQKLLDTASMEPAARGHCALASCYASGLVLIGAGPTKTLIKLIDNAPAFASSAAPKAVIFTSSSFFDPSTNKDHDGKGEGNDAYSNYIESMTIDVGVGNPGAIGIDFLANNGGAIRNVLIKAPNGSGRAGISMLRRWPGPALIENTWVSGFTIGIDVANSTYGMTFDHVKLLNQQVIGVRNSNNTLSISDIEIVNAPTPIQTVGTDSLTVIIGGSISVNLNSTLGVGDAFRNAGIAHLRNLQVTGYTKVLGAPLPSTPISGVYNVNTFLSRTDPSWSLPITDPPAASAKAYGSSETVPLWASVKTFGAKGDGDTDDTVAITNALNSGAETVYFPHGVYGVNGNIVVPSSVRTIRGFMSSLQPCGTGIYLCNAGTVARKASSVFRRDAGILIAAPNSGPLVIDKLNMANDGRGPQIGIEVTGGIFPVVVRDLFAQGAPTKRGILGAPLILENYAGSRMTIDGTNPVYGRQIDIERNSPAILNTGSPLWILGMKAEGNVTLVDTEAGGQTEVLGGSTYMVTRVAGTATAPAFISHDSKTLVTFSEIVFNTAYSFTNYLQSTVGGVVTNYPASLYPVRGLGHTVPIILTVP